MMPLAAAEHFVRAPDWTWYILFYFFLAGLAGGSYAIATLLRLWGDPSDEPAVRLGYYAAFPLYVLCPVLLTLDLGKPLRFWHMLVNTTPGATGVSFKVWSPMSVGSWALVVFGIFVTVSFLEMLVRDRVLRLPLADRAARVLDSAAGKVWSIVGGVAGLFIAGYTGVLLAVSNQPVWSDTWALGGLFLASGLSGSAALLVLLVFFVLTLVPAGTLGDAFGFPWILLWLVAFAGLLPGLRGLLTARLALASQAALASVAVPALVLLGVLALRAAVIFSAQ